jgi:hypothetical protein
MQPIVHAVISQQLNDHTFTTYHCICTVMPEERKLRLYARSVVSAFEPTSGYLLHTVLIREANYIPSKISQC